MLFVKAACWNNKVELKIFNYSMFLTFWGEKTKDSRCLILEQVKMNDPNRGVVCVCYCTYYDYLDSRYAFRGGN